MRIAIIGSRELEKNEKYHDQISFCHNTCMALARQGITFVSGLCALGMDGLAQKAYSRAMEVGWVTKENFEVYVAQQSDIDRSPLPNSGLAIVRNPNTIEATHHLCIGVMGQDHWDRCDEWARGMHSRNCHQIFGYDLTKPVDAVVCWTPNGKIQGGTATAIKLAIKSNIPVFNLGVSDKEGVTSDIKNFLIEKGAYNARR